MNRFKVWVKGEPQPLIVEVKRYLSPEGWLRNAGKYVVLNNTSYRREDIVSVSVLVSERESRFGFTNMAGI